MTATGTRRELEEFLHRQIPLTRAMGVRVETNDSRGLTLSAPLDANHNHLGTAFGGSLAALMMLAGYAFLWLELGDRDAHVVIHKSEIKFRNLVRSTIYAVCVRPEAEELEKFRADFATLGKARISLEVRVEQNDQIAATLEGIYVARVSADEQKTKSEGTR